MHPQKENETLIEPYTHTLSSVMPLFIGEQNPEHQLLMLKFRKRWHLLIELEKSVSFLGQLEKETLSVLNCVITSFLPFASFCVLLLPFRYF